MSQFDAMLSVALFSVIFSSPEFVKISTAEEVCICVVVGRHGDKEGKKG